MFSEMINIYICPYSVLAMYVQKNGDYIIRYRHLFTLKTNCFFTKSSKTYVSYKVYIPSIL